MTISRVMRSYFCLFYILIIQRNFPITFTTRKFHKTSHLLLSEQISFQQWRRVDTRTEPVSLEQWATHLMAISKTPDGDVCVRSIVETDLITGAQCYVRPSCAGSLSSRRRLFIRLHRANRYVTSTHTHTQRPSVASLGLVSLRAATVCFTLHIYNFVLVIVFTAFWQWINKRICYVMLCYVMLCYVMVSPLFFPEKNWPPFFRHHRVCQFSRVSPLFFLLKN